MTLRARFWSTVWFLGYLLVIVPIQALVGPFILEPDISFGAFYETLWDDIKNAKWRWQHGR